MLSFAKDKKIFILCTGGTIGMQPTAKGYAPSAGHLERTLAAFPEFSHADMPQYTLYEYLNPIDSANMTPQHWYEIAEQIQRHYHDYDGFVVLHGTDTMAYTASALSFMLENLSKPVILTGSQLPLYETRNDARANLLNAILLASHSAIPEVCVYFHNKLFRGNRCKKLDANSFAAFGSPNFPALAKVGTDVLIRHYLARPHTTKTFHIQNIKPLMITTLRIFPGIPYEMLAHYLQAPLQALVLETYGLGNAPENKAFLQIIRDAVAQDIIIINCSQCPTAKVKMSTYAAGTALDEAGAVSGGDMTAEAALAKLFYLFSKDLPINRIKQRLVKDLRGELTP